MTASEEDKKETRVSKRYDVLTCINITRERDFNKSDENEGEEQPPKSSKKYRSEAEALVGDVKSAARDGKITVVTAQVVKMVATKGHAENAWFDEWASIAARRAAMMYGQHLVTALQERTFYEEHLADSQRTKIVIDKVVVTALFKVCAAADEKVAGFSVCSPSDDFSKRNGTAIAKKRYKAAKVRIEKGAGGKRYEVAMAAELGVKNFGVIIGENEDARSLIAKRAEKRKMANTNGYSSFKDPKKPRGSTEPKKHLGPDDYPHKGDPMGCP